MQSFSNINNESGEFDSLMFFLRNV